MSYAYVIAHRQNGETLILKVKQNKSYALLRMLLITFWAPLAILIGGVVWAVCTGNYGALAFMGGLDVIVIIAMVFGALRAANIVEYEITDRRIIMHADGNYYEAEYSDITELTLKSSRIMKNKGDIIIKCNSCGKRASIRAVDNVGELYSKITALKSGDWNPSSLAQP